MSAITPKPKVIADWWYCGDICDCRYPRIWTPHPPEGARLYTYCDKIEDGPWSCEETTQEQWEWLLDAARRHKADNLVDIEREAAVHLDLRDPS